MQGSVTNTYHSQIPQSYAAASEYFGLLAWVKKKKTDKNSRKKR